MTKVAIDVIFRKRYPIKMNIYITIKIPSSVLPKFQNMLFTKHVSVSISGVMQRFHRTAIIEKI